MKKITLNVNKEIYESFQKICKEEDTSVASEVRKFMKMIVMKNDDEYRVKHGITTPPSKINWQ